MLASCENWTNHYGEHGMAFCISERIMVGVAVFTILMVLWQLYVYLWSHKISVLDFRVITFFMCLLSSINVFIHYGFFSTIDKGKTFFLIELFRFSIFFMMCYYYCKKASKLVSYQQWVLIFLRLLFVSGCVLIVCMGLISIHFLKNWSMKIPNSIDPRDMCETEHFKVYRYFPLLF